MNYKDCVDCDNYYQEYLLLYVPLQNEDIYLPHGKHFMQMHIKTVQQKMQENEPLVQIIDSVVDALHSTSLDTGIAV